ncbi:MAG: sigma-70 region 4 domain-containing protein, partial [Bacteroidota bacterium]
IKKNKKYKPVEVEEYIDLESNAIENDGLQNLSYKELIALIQELTPAYKAVFNMFVIDGYSHEEIAEELNISVNTSKSNLSRAREVLRKKLRSSQLQVATTGKL